MTITHSESTEWDFPNQATPVGSAAYYAIRFSPQPLRRRNSLLFAWYQLIQGIAEHPRDPGAARLKLDWWRQELGNISRVQARHPLAIELQKTGLDGSAETLMGTIVDTADEEIRAALLRDDEAFWTVCRNSLGKLFLLLAESENALAYQPSDCIELGGYCAAVERIRHLGASPHRVPQDLKPQRLEQLDQVQRSELIETLLARFQGKRPPASGRIPDFPRRLTALSCAMHSKMHRQGYPVSDTPIDRAPIAHLWTAWRYR